MIHYPSLDGLRGIAVLLVMLFHFGLLMPGWIGVQLFFVLSGYLITQGLLNTKHLSCRQYFQRFYWRRTLRIFPLNYAVVVLAAIAYAIWKVPAGFDYSWPFLVTHTTNFLRMTPKDISECFVHFWSLAVEEQFYLVWPVVVFLLPMSSFRRTVVALILLGPAIRFVLGALLRQYGYEGLDMGRLIYVNPLSHADAFAVGAVLTAVPEWKRWGNQRTLFVALALGLFVGCLHIVVLHLQGGVAWQSFGYMMYMSQNLQYVWGYTLLNLICGIAVAYCVSGKEPKRLLEHPWLMYLGKVSYGLYIFHVPILLMRDAWLGDDLTGVVEAASLAVCAIATLGVASASYRWFEAPILSFKDAFLDARSRRAAINPQG